MILLSLITGLGIGAYINIDMSLIISAGLILTIINPILSPLATCFALGLGVATTCKNVIRNAFENHVNKTKATKSNLDINNVAKEAATVATKEYKYFNSTMAFSALPLYLLHILQGLSGFLLPISIFALVLKTWIIITTDSKTAIKYSIIALLIASAAFITISSGSASSIFLYFLTLVSLPQALTKKPNTSTNLKNNTSHSTTPLKAVLYGENSSNTIISAMLLVQTILWGSGKDVLGTIINGSTGALLDPYRLSMFIIILAFIYLFNKFKKEHVIKECKEDIINKKKPSRLPGMLINLASLGFALVTVNPILVIGFALAGLILNALVDNNVIRSLVVHSLLLIGVTIG